ncbi:MAG TPA: hypothetical protein VEZ89_00215 [Rubrivivax sp.]|nr:hypothetical protein [Rubrivivax sp.]
MRLLPLMMTVGAGLLTWRFMQQRSDGGSRQPQAALPAPGAMDDEADQSDLADDAMSPNTAEKLEAENEFGAFAGGASLPDSGRSVELQTAGGEDGGDDPQAPGLRDTFRGA